MSYCNILVTPPPFFNNSYDYNQKLTLLKLYTPENGGHSGVKLKSYKNLEGGGPSSRESQRPFSARARVITFTVGHYNGLTSFKFICMILSCGYNLLTVPCYDPICQCQSDPNVNQFIPPTQKYKQTNNKLQNKYFAMRYELINRRFSLTFQAFQ